MPRIAWVISSSPTPPQQSTMSGMNVQPSLLQTSLCFCSGVIFGLVVRNRVRFRIQVDFRPILSWFLHQFFIVFCIICYIYYYSKYLNYSLHIHDISFNLSYYDVILCRSHCIEPRGGSQFLNVGFGKGIGVGLQYRWYVFHLIVFFAQIYIIRFTVLFITRHVHVFCIICWLFFTGYIIYCVFVLYGQRSLLFCLHCQAIRYWSFLSAGQAAFGRILSLLVHLLPEILHNSCYSHWIYMVTTFGWVINSCCVEWTPIIIFLDKKNSLSKKKTAALPFCLKSPL